MKLDSAAVGRMIREERKAQGLRQAELAAASGVGVRFLVELERGKPTEPPRVCRRQFGLSYAAMGISSSMA
jgi:transcriptional regulator with XRE-family HTH domain